MRRVCSEIGRIGLLAVLGIALWAWPAAAENGKTIDVPPETEPGQAEEGTEKTAEEILSDIQKEDRITKQRNAFLSETYTKSGIALYQQLNYDAAKNEFDKALEFDPNNITAKENLRKTETILGLRDARFNRILDRIVEERQVERGLAYHETKVAFAGARELMENQQYVEAIERFERVRELVKWISPYFSKDELEPYASQTEDFIVTAQKAEQARQEEARRRQREKADEVARMRASKHQQREEMRIEILLRQGRDLLAEARYAEAQSLGEQVLALDPRNKEALALRDIAFEAGLADSSDEAAKTTDEETRRTWLEVAIAQIPHSELMVYPGNWAEIIKREVQSIGATEETEPPWMQGLRNTLEDRVTFDFVETPLRDVVAFLQQITDANIVLDEDAVADLANPEVTLKVTDMKLSLALDWVLGGVDLKYALQGESIYISTEENVGGSALLKLYDVTDVTLEVKDFPGNLQMLRDRVGTSVGSSGGGAATDVGADWEDWGEDGDASESTFTPDRLIEFIKRTIAPGTWDDVMTE